MVYLPIYRVGDYAYYNNRPYKIEHIVIAGYNILVKLEHIDKVIDSTLIQVEPSKVIYRG